MRSIQVQNKLSAPHFGKDSPLSAIISAKTRLPTTNLHPLPETHTLWEAAWWGLQTSKRFQQLDIGTQNTILGACNRTLLNEAYFIEKSGLAYAAKMILLSESTDTAQLYALIGADEARHLSWIEPYIKNEDKIQPNSQFLGFLSRLIEEASPSVLVYLVQVLLEGWGLDHYNRLAAGCQYPPLAQIFTAILKDEALHHKSGGILLKPAEWQARDWRQVREALRLYTKLVQIGPLSVIAEIERIIGPLAIQELEDLLLALGHPEASHRKLTLLKRLMRQPNLESLVDELDATGCFASFSIMQAAAFYQDCQSGRQAAFCLGQDPSSGQNL